METSLRYAGDSKSLRIHAKEKFPIAANTFCQLNGELDTKIGGPTYFNAMIRHFHPDFNVGFGVQYNRNRKVHYNVRGKKVFQATADGLLSFGIKGRSEINEEFKQIHYTGAAEFIWTIINVKKDQDLRLKLGYNVLDKVPYFQMRENNWTINADGNCRWNVRYDL
ncbi:outer envelope pore protein 21B, chloroplastic-like [Andrographis paniculata]|uniref:outer envelope pore protein 21B, chloroplastic-like n=1 Tax=Andrographis paniculata TaxID=175694 RepID=UPI0021E85A7B|nr:outer envelope pore protein 21B, chloroplastic-like [Andrographis paniculata]